MRNPIKIQENMYHLPYHWFPDETIKQFERKEKQRLVFGLIKSFLKNRNPQYLDVGCGDGRWTYEITRRFHPSSATGVDFSERATNFAQLISPQITFLNHRGEKLPFDKSSFDLVTAVEVIEHVESHSESLFVKELRRVLRDDGLLILTTPSWNLQLTSHHFRHYSVERLREIFETNGFEVLSIKGQSIPWYGLKRKLRRKTSKIPKIWKLWKFTYKETAPEKSLNLILAARPKKGDK